jgi:hypothetical protein
MGNGWKGGYGMAFSVLRALKKGVLVLWGLYEQSKHMRNPIGTPKVKLRLRDYD